MQTSRFELKYLVSEETALRVRDFVRCYIGFDEYSEGRPNFSYPVHSLYLDSDSLKTYWDTINGDKNRYKLRIRYYDAAPTSPVFFEIKRRVNSCIMKQRGGVRANMVAPLLAGQFPQMDHLLSKNLKSLMAIQNFCTLTQTIHAKPRVHIFYMREAYVSDDDRTRVTMDRAVQAEENLHPSVKTVMHNPAHTFQGVVILELKFTNRFPTWFRDLIRMANAMQCGAAKYVESIQALGTGRLKTIGSVVEEPSRLSNFRRGDDVPEWALARS